MSENDAAAPGEVLRTPDDRFTDLPGWPFAPHYVDDLAGFDSLRMHYVDEGPADAERTFLCLHGQPTWAYLYRKMIPVFADAGHRVLAPDLFGFGRSDKPADDERYTFDFHRDSLAAFVERLDLSKITLVVHDWGGILGLTLPMASPERYAALVVMNTALGTGHGELPQGFLDWRAWSNANPDMAVGKLMRRATPILDEGEAAAYDAPFPDVRYKAGVRRFPNLVADHPEAPGAELSRRAALWLRREWNGASFMAIGMQDPVLGPPVMARLRSVIRGCPAPLEIADAGHFVPEWGEVVAPAALAALATPGAGT